MMNMISKLNLSKKWDVIPNGNGGYLRIDDEHPLEWFIGYENINNKTLLFISDYEPESINSSKSINVKIGQRKDEKWTLSFELIRNEQEDVFIHLCYDLIESSRSMKNDRNALAFIINRYKQWNRLMEQQLLGLMDESRRKGLIGELLYLKSVIQRNTSYIEAISGWIGPDGSDQDFVYRDGWYEIKTVGLSAKTVSISSLEQLDAELPGKLIVYNLDKTAPDDSNGFSLLEKVNEIKAILLDSQQALDSFEAKLFNYGYIDLKEYNEQKYRYGDVNQYRIDIDFPRITKTMLPTQIVAVKYEISLSAIENWKIHLEGE